jgi:hypothetical protein
MIASAGLPHALPMTRKEAAKVAAPQALFRRIGGLIGADNKRTAPYLERRLPPTSRLRKTFAGDPPYGQALGPAQTAYLSPAGAIP